VVHAVDYQLIVGQLYKLGLENILRHSVIDHERPNILWECHSEFLGGNVGIKATIRNILQVGLWWLRVFKYSREIS